MENTLNLPLISKRYHGDVVELIFNKPLGFSFVPGECVEIYDNDQEFRIYSIASGVQQDSLSFIIKKLPQGKVSSWLYDEVKEGDVLRISNESHGFFRVGETDKPFVFIATGTGIAPFISYIQSNTEPYQKQPEEIIYGVRYMEESIEVPSTIKTTYCLSADQKEHPSIHIGRVTSYLKENKADINPDYIYYICGLDQALSDVSEILIEAGVDPLNIITEIFYFQTH